MLGGFTSRLIDLRALPTTSQMKPHSPSEARGEGIVGAAQASFLVRLAPSPEPGA